MAGAKEEFADVVFGVLDLREEKDLARSVWEDGLHLCLKSKCPLHVFKPEEPLNEPYTFQVQLLYEMDEAAMMGDPMAGMPGHTPKGQTTKPNFERFERDLALLMPKAVSELPPGEAAEFRRRWDTAVIGSEVNATAFRHAARELRGTAAFAMESPKPLGSSSIQLWRSDGQAETPAIPYDASLSPLNATYLAHFARVHAQPMLQNYTWGPEGSARSNRDASGSSLGELLRYQQHECHQRCPYGVPQPLQQAPRHQCLAAHTLLRHGPVLFLLPARVWQPRALSFPLLRRYPQVRIWRRGPIRFPL